MNHFGKIFRNSNGVTLIELLIAIVITTMVIGIAYGVMITGNKTYQKIAIEGAIRDEADFVIARIMKLFYETEISDIKNCSSAPPNICIEVYNTETYKISTGENKENVSIASIDELKSAGSTITQIKIENGNLVIEDYGIKPIENNQVEIDPTKLLKSEIVNSENFEFVTSSPVKNSKIEATCSYSSAIVTNPEDNKKFIKNKCNNGLVEISLVIQKKNNVDAALQLELNSQFGF